MSNMYIVLCLVHTHTRIQLIFSIVKSLPDIDECQLHTEICEQLCINVGGSYFCSCVAGYTLGADLRSCYSMYYIYFIIIMYIMHAFWYKYIPCSVSHISAQIYCTICIFSLPLIFEV